MAKKRATKAERDPKAKIVSAWHNLKSRCSNKNNDHYHRYGGRGISYEWNSLNEFRAAMLPKLLIALRKYPGQWLSLDRINNDGNYSLENCQWIPMADNSAKDNKGKPKSEAHKLAMSLERKGKPQTESRAKLLARMHESQKKKVKSISSDGVEVIFDSIKEAGALLGVQHQNIQEICSGSNPKRKTTGGYRWEYV